MLSRFLPKSIPFFELLASQATLIQKQSTLLLSIVEQKQSKEDIVATITSLKEQSYQQSTLIVQNLSRTFITPIDKEDIHAISTAQKNIAFSIYILSIKLLACEDIQQYTPLPSLVQTIHDLLNLIQQMIEELPKKSDLSSLLIQVNTQKANGYKFILDMFFEIQEANIINSSNLKKIITLSIYYEQISKIIEQIQGIADTLEQVMIKYV